MALGVSKDVGSLGFGVRGAPLGVRRLLCGEFVVCDQL